MKYDIENLCIGGKYDHFKGSRPVGREVLAVGGLKITQDEFIELTRELLRTNLQCSPTAPMLAKFYCISTRTLSRRLQEAGFRFRDLLEEVRRIEAYRFLRETNLTVDKIARRIGYLDSSNFIKAFKRWEGETPMLYRDTHTVTASYYGVDIIGSVDS